MGMVGEACLPSNAYYPRTPDYTLCSGVHVCWSEHSDSSFVYGFMILDYGFGTMTATTTYPIQEYGGYIFDLVVERSKVILRSLFEQTWQNFIPRFRRSFLWFWNRRFLSVFTIYGPGPFCLMMQNRLNKLIIRLLQKALCEIWCFPSGEEPNKLMLPF